MSDRIETFSPSPSFPVHHGDPIALRKALKRLLFQPSMDASCPFPRGNRVFAHCQSSGSINFKRSQLTSTSELKLLWESSAARQQFQCVISRDLLHDQRNKKNIRGPMIRSSQIIPHRVPRAASELFQDVPSNSDHSSKSNSIPRGLTNQTLIIESNHSASCPTCRSGV